MGASKLAAEDFATLDAISRERALTAVESLLLERAMCLARGEAIPRDLTRELARHGIKRDMRHFRGGGATERSAARRCRQGEGLHHGGVNSGGGAHCND